MLLILKYFRSVKISLRYLLKADAMKNREHYLFLTKATMFDSFRLNKTMALAPAPGRETANKPRAHSRARAKCSESGETFKNQEMLPRETGVNRCSDRGNL